VFILLLLGCFGYRVVCVYTNWSQYRPPGAKFLPEDVDAKLCTHLIYVYAKLKGNKLEPTEWNDDGSAWSEGMSVKFLLAFINVRMMSWANLNRNICKDS
jgi:GH18 family chitinase